MRMKKNIGKVIALCGAVALAGCATTSRKEEELAGRIWELCNQLPAAETLEQRLDPFSPEGFELMIEKGDIYNWNSGKHVEGTFSYYNPSLKTLEEGLVNGDLVLVVREPNGSLNVSEKAKLKFYDDGNATIIYRMVGEDWDVEHETSPVLDPEWNINFNSGEPNVAGRCGWVYKTRPDIKEWPDEPPIDYVLGRK